jgi:hypothetical protein
MAAYQKFQAFVEHLAEGVHNFSSDSTCTITVALCNAANAPNLATHATLSQLTQIAYTNLSSRVVSVSSSAQTGGTYKLTVADLTLTASGGAAAPFRYVVLYNDDPTSPADPLICMFDYGSDLTLGVGESLLLDFDGAAGLFTIA